MIANSDIAFVIPWELPAGRGLEAGPWLEEEFMVASESVALDVLGFNLIGDVARVRLYITAHGQMQRQQCAQRTDKPCIFEHVYFARPDFMDGISVYKTRMRQGERLARKILRDRPEHDIDVVIPIPDTSRVAGQSLAYQLGVKFREARRRTVTLAEPSLCRANSSAKNRFVKSSIRAFGVQWQERNAHRRLDCRGTTCRQIIDMARIRALKKFTLPLRRHLFASLMFTGSICPLRMS